MCWGLPPDRLHSLMPTAASVSVTAMVRRVTSHRCFAYLTALLGFAFFLATFSGFRTGFFLPGEAFPLLGFAFAWESFLDFGDFPEAICDFPPKQMVHRPTGKQ